MRIRCKFHILPTATCSSIELESCEKVTVKTCGLPDLSSGRHSADKSQLQVPRNPCRFEHVSSELAKFRTERCIRCRQKYSYYRRAPDMSIRHQLLSKAWLNCFLATANFLGETSNPSEISRNNWDIVRDSRRLIFIKMLIWCNEGIFDL